MVEQWLPVTEIALGAAMLVASLIVHGFGMWVVQNRNQHFQTRRQFHLRREVAFSGLLLMMLGTHLVEVMLWAVVLTLTAAVPVFRDAYYYAAVTYTTLGYGEHTLPHQWRILAPMMAMSGVFAFGWTTSVLFSIVGQRQAVRTATGPTARD